MFLFITPWVQAGGAPRRNCMVFSRQKLAGRVLPVFGSSLRLGIINSGLSFVNSWGRSGVYRHDLLQKDMLMSLSIHFYF